MAAAKSTSPTTTPTAMPTVLEPFESSSAVLSPLCLLPLLVAAGVELEADVASALSDGLAVDLGLLDVVDEAFSSALGTSILTPVLKTLYAPGVPMLPPGSLSVAKSHDAADNV